MASFMNLSKMISLIRLLPILLVFTVGSAACGAPPASITNPLADLSGVEPTNGPAPLGAGFTELVPSSDSRIIYVSSSEGNDANTGEDEANPVATIAKGITLLRNGFPDWLLLRKGDTWYEAIGQWKKSGRSASEPMVVSAYGPSTVRPLLKTGSRSALVTNGGGGSPPSMDYLVFKGLHFYAHTRDPGNTAEYTGANGNRGIQLLSGSNFLLIEDNRFSFYTNGLAIQDYEGFEFSNIYIRNNIITDSYNLSSVGHSQGIFMKGVTSALIEGNILDHNGWHDTVDGAQKTIYNHGVYIQVDNEAGGVNVVDNIIMRSSSHGVQLRSGGLLNGNLMIENAIALQLGDWQTTLGYNGRPGAIDDNIILYGNDITATGPRGWGILIYEGFDISIANNILAHVESAGTNIVGINPNYKGNSSDVRLSNNIIHDWGTYDTGSPEDYVDPDRSIESYSISVGGAGTRADFYAQLRAQSADNWNDDYSIANIKQYFRDGFALR